MSEKIGGEAVPDSSGLQYALAAYSVALESSSTVSAASVA